MILFNPQEVISRYRYPSLGLLYIASSAKEAGEPVRLIDLQHKRGRKEWEAEDFSRERFFGITSNVANWRSAAEMSARLHKISPEAKRILGGPLVAIMYEKMLPEFGDIAVIEEGEQTIREIVKGKPLDQIRGIAYWDGEMRINPPRDRIENLDSIKFPDYSLLNFKYYFSNTMIPGNLASMITSRGCPYHCKNCTKWIHGNKIRLRSEENVIEEMTHLYNDFGVRTIHFWDDNFTFYPRRVKSLCEKIIKSNLKGLTFGLPNGIRADKGDDEMFELLARAGFTYICVAVESGNQDVNRELGKDLDLARVAETVRRINRVGILTSGFFMIGLPFETVENMKETVNFACECGVEQAIFFITIPFPGTELYEIVNKNGWFINEVMNGFPSYDHGKAVFETDQFSGEDVERIFRWAYRKFYLHPGRMLKLFRKRIRLIGSISRSIALGFRIILTGKAA